MVTLRGVLPSLQAQASGDYCVIKACAEGICRTNTQMGCMWYLQGSVVSALHQVTAPHSPLGECKVYTWMTPSCGLWGGHVLRRSQSQPQTNARINP